MILRGYKRLVFLRYLTSHSVISANKENLPANAGTGAFANEYGDTLAQFVLKPF
jgi:hypothetical protein